MITQMKTNKKTTQTKLKNKQKLKFTEKNCCCKNWTAIMLDSKIQK